MSKRGQGRNQMLLPFHELILEVARAEQERIRRVEFARRRHAADARQAAIDDAQESEARRARSRARALARNRTFKTTPDRGKAAGSAS